MVERILIDDTIPKNCTFRLWEESKDNFLNKILSEEWLYARVPARRNIHLMVPETDDMKMKWYELPVVTQYFNDGSVNIEFRFKPSIDTYEASRCFIRNSLLEIEVAEGSFNYWKTVDFMVSTIPYIIEAGKMKFR